MDAKKTGELIAQLRRERGLNQTELAELLGVTNKAISRWETGRGYPDIETLPKISEVLNISIPELLSGERETECELEGPHQQSRTGVDRSIETVCQYAGEQTRMQKKKSTLLSVMILLLGLIVVAFQALPMVLDMLMYVDDLYFSASDFYWSIVGSADCVIAEDYKSLTYLDKTYLPLPVNGYEAERGEEMVGECQVEGAGFLGKLFFGETLYEVKNIPNQEVVYLQTDYDHCISRYFVLESEYDRYIRIMDNAVFENYYATYSNESSYRWDRRIGDDLGSALRAAQRGAVVEEPDTSIDSVMVQCFDEGHCFFYYAGRLIKAEDGYYWRPAIHSFTVSGGWNMTDEYYRIHGFDDELGRLFSD